MKGIQEHLGFELFDSKFAVITKDLDMNSPHVSKFVLCLIAVLIVWSCESSLDSFREEAKNTGLSSSSIDLHGLDAHLAAATAIYPSSTWVTGTVYQQSVGKDTVVYVVQVEAGQSITFQWDDSYQGSGYYTADVFVTIFDAFGNEVMSRRDSGYNSTVTLTTTSDRYYVLVDQYTTSDDGSFAIKADYTYGAPISSSSTFLGSPVYELSLSQWMAGALRPMSGSFDTIVYRVPVVPGVAYRVQWDDSYSGSGTYTLDINVAIFNEDQSYLLTWTDSGYNITHSLVPTGNYIYILVKNYGSGSSGTFAILVSPYL